MFSKVSFLNVPYFWLLGQVLLHLIKGGMTYSELNESDSSPTAEAV